MRFVALSRRLGLNVRNFCPHKSCSLPVRDIETLLKQRYKLIRFFTCHNAYHQLLVESFNKFIDILPDTL